MAEPDALTEEAAASAQARSGALVRRLFTIPRTLILLALVTPALPLLFVIGASVDAARAVLFKKRWVTVRLVAFLEVYLLAEIIGVAALFLDWIATGLGSRSEALIDRTYATQGAWVGFLFGALSRLFDLRFEVDGDEAASSGPILVFIQHTSIADVLIPTVFITRRRGIRLRFVLKRELLQDPCLDVAGHRIPNHFVARNAKESAAEIEAVRELTRDLGPNEGVLIYPEGTRFTERKRQALLERLAAAGGPAYARAERFKRVLPPRLGGPLALLDGLDGFTPADAVFVAHKGLEGFATVGDIWSGSLIGRTVRVRMWRVSKSSIPASKEERAAWLDEQWAAVDAWVGAG
jgi:1-acyl-sn-glycerol-3-phosphate acyltransferase